MEDMDIKKLVREGYAGIVRQNNCCSTSQSSCCGSAGIAQDISRKVGYTEQDLASVPGGANLGLGCGNPVALASLKEGETVLDLGSGAGFDCFLAAQKVGDRGKVIGVDMTPEMIERARENAGNSGYANVEFRLGEAESLPVADASVDVVISNCVVNLSPAKKKVFQEAFRVLRPGGRLMVSDIVLLKELPDSIKKSTEAYIGCLSGAIMKGAYLQAIREAGFQEVHVLGETPFPVECMCNDPTAKTIIEDVGISAEKATEVAASVVSVRVEGVKPKMTDR